MRDRDYVSNDVETAAYLARENEPAWDDRPSAEEAVLDVLPRNAEGWLIPATTATAERLAA